VHQFEAEQTERSDPLAGMLSKFDEKLHVAEWNRGETDVDPSEVSLAERREHVIEELVTAPGTQREIRDKVTVQPGHAERVTWAEFDEAAARHETPADPNWDEAMAEARRRRREDWEAKNLPRR
jgi:hypothetical protein